MADELVRYEGTKETVGLPAILAGSMPAEVRGRGSKTFSLRSPRSLRPRSGRGKSDHTNVPIGAT
jgi:hypothetical protein